MKIFYIDYENVKDEGLNGITKLEASDTVKIFYSEDAQRMSFGTHRRIIESQAIFAYQKLSPDMKTLQNALDVLIVHDLEKTMNTDKNCEYYIVSNDKDFDGFVEEKRKKKYKINRIPEVCKANATSNEIVKNTQETKVTSSNKNKSNAAKQKEEREKALQKKEQVVRSYIGQSLREYNDCRDDIVEAYMGASSKQELNNRLQQYFDNEDVSIILAALKNLTKDMPGR